MGECQHGITRCFTDPNTQVTSLKCLQLTVPDPNLPSPTDPNRNEDPNDKVSDPNHQLLFPAAELCNNKDDNCNGDIDDLGSTIAWCGVRACERLGTCDPLNNPALTCTAGTPSPEICNGIDDNCDGKVDNADPNDPNNLVGIACNTGHPGSCAPGIAECIGLN